MRVALISWESLAGPSWTEGSVVVSDTAAALAAHGAQVHVFTGRGPRQAPEVARDGALYHRCRHDSSGDVWSFGRAAAYRLAECEREGRFGVVHGFGWPAVGALSELRRAGRRGLVWSVAGEQPASGRPAWLEEAAEGEVRSPQHPEEFADRVIVPCAEARERFLEQWRAREDLVEVIHPGVDPGWAGEPVDPATVKARYGMGVYDPMLLCPSPLSAQGRPGLALDAMPQVLERHPEAKLVFAGDGELRGHLADRAQVLGVQGAVRLPGEPGPEELGRLCQACDAVLLPERAREYGGFVLEAWAVGKPAVAARSHAGATFIWHEVTGYVAEDSSDGLAEGVLWMLADFDRCRWVGGNGRRAVEEAFGWPAVAARLLACYQSVGQNERTQ